MQVVHGIAIACAVGALGLLVAGLPGAAAAVIGLSTLVELVGAAITGKQTNDTER